MAVQTSSQIQMLDQQVPQKIEIGTVPAVLGVIVLLFGIGVAWGNLKTLVSNIKNTLDDEIKPDLKDLRERFGIVEDRVSTLWKDKIAPASSPRQLNTRGEHILSESGIKDIVDENKEKLLGLVKKQGVKNPYDAENAIIAIMTELPKHCPEIVDKLKEGAFQTGTDIGSILFVGSVYLRNLIFKDLGFDLKDLDKPRAGTKK
jgi:hypothetical protein